MNFLGKMIIIVVCLLLSGCTLHFKGKDIEFDAERQRVQDNSTFELTDIVLLGD